MNIAIDGPAGAGKSTIARKLAEELGYVYVDTGAMYRAMALFFLEQGIAASNEQEISVAASLIDLSIRYQDGEQQVLLNGENVNGKIRTEEVGNMASATSVYPDVRRKLVALQQKLASDTDVIMDGRDIGTCVLPNAEVSSATRAKRRYDELCAKGETCDLNEIRLDIEERDARDMNRETSPLKQAEDAVLVDSSDLTVEEVVETIRRICRKNYSI